jgi:WD40 repeat protein
MVAIWDTREHRMIKAFRFLDVRPVACTASLDGRLLVLCNERGRVHVYDIPSGLRQAMARLDYHYEEPVCCAISRDGECIAYGTHGGVVYLWNWRTAEHPVRMSEHCGVAECCAFSRGTLLVSGSADTTVLVWNTAVRARLHTLRGHTQSVFACGFTPDETRVVSAAFDRTTRVWDVARGVCLYQHVRADEPVAGGVLSPDGCTLATFSVPMTIWLWDVRTGSLCARGPQLGFTSARIRGCAMSPDSSMAASPFQDETSLLWRTGRTNMRVKVLRIVLYGNRYRRRRLPAELWFWMEEQGFLVY